MKLRMLTLAINIGAFNVHELFGMLAVQPYQQSTVLIPN